MCDESQEERTVEVQGLPDGFDEELLSLYFENKRRSGGGSLVSVEIQGCRALLVFEKAEAAAQVLSRGHHALHNIDMTVRKPASRDRHRLLLRGVNPNTSSDLVELFVENMVGVSMPDYTLHPTPERDVILIQLRYPLLEDFHQLKEKVSSRALNRSKVTLEQIEQTDSILVENLHPDTSKDHLTLYFESKRGGNHEVKDVVMLSEGMARVSFVEFKSVDNVLQQTHKLEGADLVLRPYFEFLQPQESFPTPHADILTPHATDRDEPDLSDSLKQISPPVAVASNSDSSPPVDVEPLPVFEEAEAPVDTVEIQARVADRLSCNVTISDPDKFIIFQQHVLQDIEKDHPHVYIQLIDNGVHVAGPNAMVVEKLKDAVLKILSSMAQTVFTCDPVKADFLKKKEVREALLQTLNGSGLPATYTVSDCDVTVTSLSLNLASQACSVLQSQLCEVRMQVEKEYECMLYTTEWSEFIKTLDFCSVRLSEHGGDVDLLTLKGMDSEKQTAILLFLSMPITKETVISMEPGMLKYIQVHCHQLLADMSEVSIFPLEAEDVCGLKIHGNAVASQMAEEVLQGVVSSVCTRTITVNTPGIARFLDDPDCKRIMKEMETKFQVFVLPKFVPWETLQTEDIYEVALKAMPLNNFPKVELDESAADIKSDLMLTDLNFNNNGTPQSGLLEEAKRIVSAIDQRTEELEPSFVTHDDMDDLDLYCAEQPASLLDQDNNVVFVSGSHPLPEHDAHSGLVLPSVEALSWNNLDEEAQLSLAIQYSMESSQWSLADEEEQLQKALALSKEMIQHGNSSNEKANNPPVQPLETESCTLLEEAIKAANTIQLLVYAGYSCDLIRVDIAFGKKVSQRQVEEKLEHKSMKNMSVLHKKCLEVIERKHAVKIEIKGTIVIVSGFKDYVAQALPQVKLLLEKISRSPSEQEILKTVQWMHTDPVSSAMTPYSPGATVFIDNAWRLKQKKVNVLFDNQPHIINFEKMQEYNVASGKSMKICRQLLTAEEEDVSDYSLLSNLPEATVVHEESEEFQNVVKDFYATIKEHHNKIRIIKVEKIMNQLLYSQYKLKKASIVQHAIYPEVERILYHGTSEGSVKEICIHGFNRSFCGKNATVYGQGVYFAVNSALSVKDQYSPPNTDGHKYVFVSRVLTGDYTRGCHSMKTAPLKETSDIPLRYDSVTDDINEPSMFVIFNDTQAYPDYLITCQKIYK
ncbi:protein mono-ADP-ribosyltransferase PARP10 isoform X3 [Thalassophryne amazonica]|uniref:protein mono-ADP-ribosyltransferase PARP10 isoform X3 n=1 Tax=Thalassophryne amazonica TaxID=390379 RepID=UPI001471D275|nr:protein mono-ADP-ribosyltransferase PARP10 isoform X3 [Thalassophryne amazonica]